MYKMKKETRKKLVYVLIILILAGASFLVVKNITANVIKQTPDTDWLSDNCDCIENEKIKCREEFEFDEERGFCKRTVVRCPSELVLDLDECETETQVTNFLLGCSKYNCSGEIYNI